MTSYQLQAPDAPSSMTARDVFQLLWRRSSAILICLGLTAGITYFITTHTRPAWTATTQMIMVEHSANGLGTPGSNALNPPPESVDTQTTMLQTQAMIDRVIKYISDRMKQDKDSSGAVAGTPYYSIAFNPGNPQSRVVKLSKLPEPNILSSSLNVWNPRNTNLVYLSVEAEPEKGTDKPQDASEALTQAVALAFVQWKNEIVKSNFDQAVAALTVKAQKSEDAIKDWRRRNVGFKENHHLWNVSMQYSTALQEYLKTNEMLNTANNDLTVMQAKSNNLNSEVKDINTLIKAHVPVPDDEMLLHDQAEIAKLQNDYNTLALHVTTALPGGLNDIAAQIKTWNAKLAQDQTLALSNKRPSLQEKGKMLAELQGLDTEIVQQKTRVANLTSQQASRLNALHDANQVASEYDKISEEGKDVRAIDETLQTALNSIKIAQNEASGNMLISQLAYSPDDPSRPNWLRNSLFGGVLGILLSFIVVALLEQGDQRIRTMGQIRTLMPGPIIGTLPKLSSKQMSALLQGDSVDYESYSLARANLGLALRSATQGAPESGQIVLVTSSVPGEGKTVTAVSLARSAARSGKRTILVNADLRHPALNDLFNTAEAHGLADVLSGAMSLDEALVQSDTPYLDILHSGTPDRNPSDLVSQPQMADVMEALRAEADLVIIDTPPCSVVADALILSPFADCILQVVSIGMADQQVVTDTITALSTAEPKAMVFFVNRAPAERPKLYGQYYYHQNGKSDSNGSAKPSAGEAQPMALPNATPTSGELVDSPRHDDPTA